MKHEHAITRLAGTQTGGGEGQGGGGAGLEVQTRLAEGAREAYQTGWLDQALSCRWGHVPGSVLKTGKFKLPGFRGEGSSCN